MSFLLDTNVLSELRKAGQNRADPNVIAWISNVDASSLYVSVITLLEVELGILRLQRRDRSAATKLRTWFDDYVLPEFRERTFSVDVEVALRSATLHVPDPRPDRDALIAATALVHGLTVVTRNVADFEPTSVPLLNPWLTP